MDAAQTLIVLQPETEGLAEQAKQIFAKSKKNGFSFVSRFPAGSPNARKSVPLLVGVIGSPDKKSLAVSSLNGSTYTVEPWQYACKILSDYGDSVLDVIEDELKSSSQRTKVVREMKKWRERDGQPHEELDKLLNGSLATRGFRKGAAKSDEAPSNPKYVKSYRVERNASTIFSYVKTMWKGEKDVRLDQDSKSGNIIFQANKEQHQLMIDMLKVLVAGAGKTEPRKNNGPYLCAYKVESDPETAFPVLRLMIEGSDAKMDQEPMTGKIYLLAEEALHKKVRELIKTLNATKRDK